jgi:hypothetical protein
MRKPGRRAFDAETTFFGPLILVVSLAAYLAALSAVLVPFTLGSGLQFIMDLAALAFTGSLVLGGLALVYASKPRRLIDALWIPFLYLYWNVLAFVALYAMACILFRRSRVWTKSEKTGVIASDRWNV